MTVWDDEDALFTVVVNDEDQYSIWPADRDIPGGWHRSEKTGRRSECLSYIEQHWTDMRPRTLRELNGRSTMPSGLE
jgi:MbtH protein